MIDNSEFPTMKQLLILPFLLLTLLVAYPAFPADFHKGMDAFEKGDYATALKIWEPIAKEGDTSAQFQLGNMYTNGHGVTIDHKTAYKWYLLAARQGYAAAESSVGFAYRRGLGVKRDRKVSIEWYTAAAEKGFIPAQIGLGIMHTTGGRAKRNNTAAYMWWSIAAMLGDKEAMKLQKMIAERMNPGQINEAKRLAHTWVKEHGG
jgi:hypothetical protein